MNRVNLYGNLTKDVELRQTEKTVIATTSIAVTDEYNRDKTHFFDLKAFSKTAELMSKHFAKGDPILVEGKLTQEVWEKDNKKNSKVLVTVERITFTRGKKDVATVGTESVINSYEDDDDLPF